MKASLISAVALLLLGVLSVSPASAQTRPDLRFCGTTDRSGSDLYGAAGPFNEINSCTPDSDTRALLVTRSGAVSVPGKGAAWLDYLNAGGVIITEYTVSEDVYNEIYGTALASGSTSGPCNDNVMPVDKLNPDDPFWIANPIPDTPPGSAGCGADLQPLVSAQAELTALGARDNGDVSLAYRRQGNGVLFLAEADWQDSDAGYSDDSRALMAAMITSAAAAQPSPIPALPLWALVLLLALLAGAGLRRH